MRTKLILLAGILAQALCRSAVAQGTAFTYQGFLTADGAAATGTNDFEFRLFDDATLGTQHGATVTIDDLVVNKGLFTVTLDFGVGVFDGRALWLGIAVRPGASAGAYTQLTPRQAIASTPYAVRALSISGSALSEFSDPVSLSNPANIFTGTFTGDGSALTNLNVTTLDGLTASNVWQLNGNAGTSPGLHFLGTTDSRPLELKVNGKRVLRLEMWGVELPNLIGGSSGNQAGTSVYGSVIAGGGSLDLPNTLASNGLFNVVGGGAGNSIATFSSSATIAGGLENQIGVDADHSTIGAGSRNVIGENSQAATIAGGSVNLIEAFAYGGAIGGGAYNRLGAASELSAVGGGAYNSIDRNSSGATVAGGIQNRLGENAVGSAVGGGSNNVVRVDAPFVVIGGGERNTIDDASRHAVVAGGRLNYIGTNASYAVLGGGDRNAIVGGSTYATIAGGRFNYIGQIAESSAVGGGYDNFILDYSDHATVAGGYRNGIREYSHGGAIGGGFFNYIEAFSRQGHIGGGSYNTVSSNSPYAVISGGRDNSAEGNGATIGGGSDNVVAADYATTAGGRENVVLGVDATVGGGSNNEANSTGTTTSGGINNRISVNSPWATIGGGYNNAATGTGSTVGGGNANATTNSYSTVSGGQANTASKSFATVPGGANNTADGTYAFAAGRRAKALHQGAFVWGDSSDSDVISTNSNSVTMRASGGYRLFSTAISTGASPGVLLASGDSAWSTLSDRNAKKNVQPLDTLEVLAKLVKVPVHLWNYKTESDTSVPHIGPMAQEFKAAFYPGRDDKGITTLEFDGVALAAIQGLNQKVDGIDSVAQRRIQTLEAENAELKARLERLEQLLHVQVSAGGD